MRAGSGAVEHLDQPSGLATGHQDLEEGLEGAVPRQPRKALPDGIPVAERLGQSPPGDVVHREIVQRLQEATVIVAFLAPPRANLAEDIDNQAPPLVGHPRQHGRLQQNQPTMNHATSRPGIRQICMAKIPSTQPKQCGDNQ